MINLISSKLATIDLSALYKLTLICNTYNRDKFLARSAKYWSQFPLKVIYMDGSDLRSSVDFNNYINITYINDTDSYSNRLIKAFNLCDTKYTCIIPDDEFFIPSALQQCINFLDVHPDYVSCGGEALLFSIYKDTINLETVYPNLHRRHFRHTSPLFRLSQHFKKYEPSHYYSIHRTPIAKNVFNFIDKFRLSAANELFVECLLPLHGKSINLPILFWLRSKEVLPIRSAGELCFDESLTFTNFWTSSTLANQKSEFLRYISSKSAGLITLPQLEYCFDLFSLSNYQHPDPTENPISRFYDNDVAVDSAALEYCLSIVKQFWNI